MRSKNILSAINIEMKFYSFSKKASVDVANSNVTIRVAKNGRYQAVARLNGDKLSRFVDAETAQRLGAPALPASAKKTTAKRSARKTTRKARKSTRKATRKSTKKTRKSTRRSTRRRSTRRA